MQNKTMPATRQFMTNWSVPASQPHPAPQQGFPDGAKQAEIWVETKASGGDDKFYYYNVKTRETTWTRPEGPNIKIMQQSQVDLLAKSTMGPGAGAGPGPGGAAVPPVAFSMPPPFGMPPPGAWPPNPGPWPNAAGGPPGMPPPWAAGVGGQPPAPSMMAAAAAASKKLYPNDALIMSKVDKKILEAAAEWTEHRAPDGRFYFYNTKRGDSVWEKPSALRDLELAKAAVAQALSVINKEPPGMKMTGDFASNVNNVQRNNNRSLPASMVPGMSAPIAKKTPQTAQKSNAVADKSKPVQSTPVPGTPWCVVWTGDGRVFFYNPSTKTSIWERPEELIGRNEVDKLVTTPPPSVTVDASSSSTAAAAAAAVAARLAASSSTAAAAPAALARKRVQNENDSDASSDSDSDPEPEPKRSRSDLFMGASGGRQPQNVTKTDTTTNNNDGGEDLMAPGTSDLTLPLTATTTTSTETADETSAATAATTENGHANAVDMEVQAARDRATIPLDDRIKSFREMLVEKDVSAFSTWEKELHKIVFDRRYLLLTSRERKQVFDRYVKDRAEEERKEKRQKIKEKREAFKRLLSDANLTGKSSFNDFVHRYSKDERYRNIEKLREREELFTDYVTNLRRKEKEDKIQRRESARKEFTEMLKENTEIERYSHWIDVKKRFESDSRYRAVESSSMRELWFKDYCRTLQQLPYKDERKKNKEQRSRTAGDDQHREKDKDRERKHHHHHHHRDSKKSSAITNDSNNTENWDDDDNGGGGGVEVLDSKRDKNKDGKKSSKSKSSGDKSTSNQNDDVNGHKDGDGDAMENGDLNGTRTEDKNGRNEDEEVEEEEEEEGCIADSDENDDDAADATANNKNRQHLVDYELEDGEEIGDEKEFDEAEREKRARTEASLREREKEVQRTLASHLRDRDKEREQHQQSEAVEQFKALLVDCVRSSEMTWKEAKKAMKKDGTRWQLVEILSRDDRDRLFNDHHEHLFKKKREKFRELLDETVPQLAAGAVWKDLKKAIKDDPRYVKFGSSDKCEREYRDYVRDRTNQEKHDFRELLAETKLLTHKSLELFADKSDAYLQEIEEVLKKDQRYHKMDHIPSERRQFIINYIEDLAKKGPPPPPTATNDKSRRLK